MLLGDEMEKDTKKNNVKIKDMKTWLHVVENRENDQQSDKIKNLETKFGNLHEIINNKD